MATYMELYSANNDSDLQDKVAVAVIIAAEMIRTDASPPDNQNQRLQWGKLVMNNPVVEAKRMLWAVLAANKDIELSQILGASDEMIQSKVDDAIDLFAGFAGSGIL